LSVPTSRALLIAAEQVRTQYRNMPTAFISNAVVSLVLCFALREAVPLPTLGWWLCAAYAWVLGRFLLWRTFKRADPPASDIAVWRAYGIAGSALLGIIWGLGGLMLYVPGNLSSQFLLLIAQVGMGSGAAYASASVLSSFLSYFYPSLLLSAVPFFKEGDSAHVSVGIMLLLFVAATTHFTIGVSRTIVDAIKLRFENIDLIGELREQTTAAQSARQAAEEANIAKSRFLAAASHDLRQPLHALGFFVDALREHTSAEERTQIVGNIRRSVDTMEELFNALLDVSRLDAGIVEPHVVTVPLAPLLERVRFEFEPFARQKGLSLTAMNTRTLVRSDPALLERVIRNLVTNAVRYTDRGGIVIGCRPRSGAIRIEVWDSGRGIPPEKHHEIFQEFYQLENPERDRRKGLGLGLAIVERLTRLLDHRVELLSTVGKGSMFCVTVPRGRPEDRALDQPLEPIALDGDVADALILLIDDEIDVRDGMQSLLSRWRCNVVAASSSAEILEKVSGLERLPDLIVADYRLRGEETGIQVVERLREEFNAEIPALIVTGDTGPDRLREVQASGLHILHKPLNPSRLRALIASLRCAQPT
jgi:two-component system, sensor histidine kinase